MEDIIIVLIRVIKIITICSSLLLAIFLANSYFKARDCYREHYDKQSDNDFTKNWCQILFDNGKAERLTRLSVVLCIAICFSSSLFVNIVKKDNIEFLSPGTYTFFVSVKEIDNGRIVPAEIRKKISDVFPVRYVYELCSVESPSRTIIPFGTKDIVVQQFPDYYTIRDSDGRISSLRYNEDELRVDEYRTVYSNGRKMSCELINKHADSVVLRDDGGFTLKNFFIFALLQCPAVIILLLRRKFKIPSFSRANIERSDADIQNFTDRKTVKNAITETDNSPSLIAEEAIVQSLLERMSLFYKIVFDNPRREDNEWEENDLMLFALYISCFYLTSEKKCRTSAVERYLKLQMPQLRELSRTSPEIFNAVFEDRFKLYKMKTNGCNEAGDALNVLVDTFGDLIETDYALNGFRFCAEGIPISEVTEKSKKYENKKDLCLQILINIMRFCDPTLT